ncbi:MAG: Gfo/Idh/MocA family oxidoreductase [Phycisphaerae bacterium]|nr:Gfo/Idh/MocA family oxidoreductase [Phycisphaerae bacterium]
MANQTVKRRTFLKASVGALAFPYVVPSSVLGQGGAIAPSNKIAMGAIGVGPQGTGVMRGFMAQNDARVVAVCDVKSNVLADRKALVDAHYGDTGCAAYGDFRELLARDDIDGVSIASCDHWHVLHAIAAARAKKDVYLEKPMGLSMAQDQALRAACKRYGTVFQFGTQQRSDRQFLQACELVRNGKIGELKTINVWSPGSSAGGSPEVVPVPEWLNYDFWLGPAPATPYTKDRSSNSLWWFISDYALGFIAGWGVHPLDIALWGGGDKTACNLEIKGAGVFPTEGVANTALNWDVKVQFESGVRMNFTGYPFPEEWKKRYGRTSDHGTAFEGTEGWVHVDRGGINAHPQSLLTTEFGPNDTRLYKSTHHQRNLLDCMRTRAATVCGIEDAVAADTLCQLSDIATRLEKKLKWDWKRERFIDDPAADRMLSRPMRSPWKL